MQLDSQKWQQDQQASIVLSPMCLALFSSLVWFSASVVANLKYGQLHTYIILKYRCWNFQEIGVVASSVVNHMLQFINFLVSKIGTGTSSCLRLLDASFHDCSLDIIQIYNVSYYYLKYSRSFVQSWSDIKMKTGLTTVYFNVVLSLL